MNEWYVDIFCHHFRPQISLVLFLPLRNKHILPVDGLFYLLLKNEEFIV